MTSKIFSGAEIARAAKNKRTIQLTKSQSAKAAKKAITTKYGKIDPAAYYYHSSNGAWVKYSKEKDDKVISNNKARDKKTLDNYPQKYDGFKTGNAKTPNSTKTPKSQKSTKQNSGTKKQSRLSGPKSQAARAPTKKNDPELHRVNEVIKAMGGKRNIYIPKMTVSRLNRLLTKQKLTKDDVEDLLDYKYFILTDPESAHDMRLLVEVRTDGLKPTYILKNKFWLLNIDDRVKDFKKQAVKENTSKPKKSVPKSNKAVSKKPVNAKINESRNQELESIYGMDIEAMESEIIKMDKSSKRTNPKSMKFKGKSIKSKVKNAKLNKKTAKQQNFEYVKAKYDELINNPNYQNPYSRPKFISGLKSDVRDYNYKLSKSFYRENQERKNNIIANMRAAEAVIRVAKLNKSKKPTGAAVLEMNFERTPFLNGEDVIKAYSKNLLNKGLSREKTLTATADKFKLDSSDVKILQKELKKMKSIPEMIKKVNPKKLGYSGVKIDTKRKKVYFKYPVGTGNRLKSKNNPKHHILTFSKLNNFSDTGELEQYLRAKIQNVRNSNAINKSNYKSKRGVFEMNKNSSKVITKRENIKPTKQIKLL